jgi:hypothetical protein
MGFIDMKTFLTFISLCILTACGGGGGGSSAPAAITYTYDKMSAAGAGTNFDVDSAAWLWSEAGYGFLWATSEGESEGVPLDISVDSNLNTVVKFDTTTIVSDQDSPASMSWEIVDDAFPESAGNILDDYAAWTVVYGTDKDLVSLTEVGFKAQAYGFYVENGDAFLGTEYVSPLTIFKDYGSSANPYNVGGSSDSLFKTEVISSVIGDKTESGDMPSSGSYQYSSRAVGILHAGEFPLNTRFNLHVMGLESDGIIDVDHTGKTVSGSVTLDYLFAMGSCNGSRLALADGSPASFGTVSFEGTITGKSVSGTASFSYPLEQGGPDVASTTTTEAQFFGSFYGPNGSEFGGVILIQEYESGSEITNLSVSVVAAR